MLTPGQKLYWVPSQRSHMPEQEVTVAKVGRKWATLEGGRYRIDMTTLYADAGQYSSPGRCYLDKEAFFVERETNKVWRELLDNIRHVWSPPDGVTINDIRAAMVLLRVIWPFKG